MCNCCPVCWLCKFAYQLTCESAPAVLSSMERSYTVEPWGSTNPNYSDNGYNKHKAFGAYVDDDGFRVSGACDANWPLLNLTQVLVGYSPAGDPVYRDAFVLLDEDGDDSSPNNNFEKLYAFVEITMSLGRLSAIHGPDFPSAGDDTLDLAVKATDPVARRLRIEVATDFRQTTYLAFNSSIGTQGSGRQDTYELSLTGDCRTTSGNHSVPHLSSNPSGGMSGATDHPIVEDTNSLFTFSVDF